MVDQLCPDCGHDMCRAHWLHLDAHGRVDKAYTRVVTAECRERMGKLIATLTARALAAEKQAAAIAAQLAEITAMCAESLDGSDGLSTSESQWSIGWDEGNDSMAAAVVAIIAKHEVGNV